MVTRLTNPGAVPSGFTTLIVLMLLIGGIQLLFLGVIGSYIAHIYEEVKRRPSFIVESILNPPEPRTTSTTARIRRDGDPRPHGLRNLWRRRTIGELYPASLAGADFNTGVFSQRRLPDRIHYRMVRCRRCGLVRADPAADAQTLEKLYERSEGFDEEEGNLRRTYGRYLRRLRRHDLSRGQPAGDRLRYGFFLLQARVEGYGVVTGIEPSRAAAALADPLIATRIVQGVMKPGPLRARNLRCGVLVPGLRSHSGPESPLA